MAKENYVTNEGNPIEFFEIVNERVIVEENNNTKKYWIYDYHFGKTSCVKFGFKNNREYDYCYGEKNSDSYHLSGDDEWAKLNIFESKEKCLKSAINYFDK